MLGFELSSSCLYRKQSHRWAIFLTWKYFSKMYIGNLKTQKRMSKSWTSVCPRIAFLHDVSTPPPRPLWFFGLPTAWVVPSAQVTSRQVKAAVRFSGSIMSWVSPQLWEYSVFSPCGNSSPWFHSFSRYLGWSYRSRCWLDDRPQGGRLSVCILVQPWAMLLDLQWDHFWGQGQVSPVAEVVRASSEPVRGMLLSVQDPAWGP